MDEKIVALDVGTTTVRCVIGEVSSDDQITLLGFGEHPTGDGVKQGNIIDINKTTEAIIQAVGDAENRAGIEYAQEVVVSISGDHLRSFNVHGKAAIKNESQEITRLVVEQTVNAAKDNIDLGPNHELIHNIPQFFEVDGQKYIENPIGMVGSKLEVDLHSIACSTSAIRNLEKCCEVARLDLDEIVFKGLAASEAVLTPDQKKLGVVLVEMGGGTTDVTVFMDSKIVHSAVIPIGGEYITNDIAIGMNNLGYKISMAAAEQLKIEHGTVGTGEQPEDEIEVHDESSNSVTKVDRELLKKIIEARLDEIFDKIKLEIERFPDALKDRISSGIVMSGGCSKLNGITEFAQEKIGVRTQKAVVQPFGGPNFEDLNRIENATCLGLLKFILCIHSPVEYPEVKEGFFAKIMRKFRDWLDDFFDEEE